VNHIRTPPAADSAPGLFEYLQGTLGEAYRLERELGGGGMARLFLAVETALGRQVVVKVLPPDTASALNAARFQREIELTAHLQHPHILPLLSAGARDGLLYYITPFIAGESLRHRIEREGALPVVDACRYLRELADALAFAHAEGVVHRDMKPENVLLQGGHALLADFGVAGALIAARATQGEGGRLTSTGHSVGTPLYMAPEQLAADDQVDGRADIFALGMMGYEMLAGERPFAGRTGAQLLVARLTETPPLLHTVRADVPPELSEAINTALAHKPELRWQWAAEFHDAVEAATPARGTVGRVTRAGADGAATGSAPAITAGAVTAPVRPSLIISVARRRAWKWMLYIGLPVIVASAATAAVLRWRASARLDLNLIAVAPFETYNPALTVWREGLVDILSRNLDGAGALRTVSPTIIVRQWGEGTRVDDVGAAQLGKQTGARYVVYGSLETSGRDSVKVTAQMLDAATGKKLREQPIERRGPSDRMDAITDSLTIALLDAAGQQGAIAGFRGTSLGSSSLQAVKAFLDGERFYRRANWDSAIAHYERAVAEDSTFALALRRLGIAISWRRDAADALTRDYLRRAGQFNRRLPARDSLLVAADSIRAVLGYVESDTAYLAHTRRLFATLRATAERWPRDPEVRYALADAYYHFGVGPKVWIPARQVLQEFDRAIALDSAFAPSYIHAVELGLWLEGAELGKRYADKYVSLQPTDVEGVGIRIVERLFERGALKQAATRRLLDTTDVSLLNNTWLYLRRWSDSAESSVELARGLATRSVAEGRTDSLYARRRLASQLAWRGHGREAYAVLGSRRERLFAELVLVGAIPTDSAAAAFHSWVGEGAGEASFALPWLADHRDTATILILSQRVAQRMENPVTGSRGGYDSAAVQAYLALARRDSTDALRRFAALPDSLCLACALDRLTFARLLSSQGRSPEAARILDERLPTLLSTTELLFSLERARVAGKQIARMREAGDAAGGTAEEQRRTELCRGLQAAWRSADAPLLGRVADACGLPRGTVARR
jgi:serine/threonine-protein kinase